ncbi:MAG: TIGR03086 family metal-binding protein [Pseudonocardia sp.]|nr:TIGR03086 family metal-binding protein [Pseudonocardia sp.]
MIDLKPACRELATLVAGVTDDQLSRPTASDGWTVRGLLDHLEQVAGGFAGIAGSEPEIPDDADSVARILALGRAWDDPAAWQGRSGEGVLDLPRALWGRIALTEVVVHGWELGRAVDRPFAPPEDSLKVCLEHVLAFLPNAPVPEIWGPPVEISVDAPLIDQVVAATGRRP